MTIMPRNEDALDRLETRLGWLLTIGVGCASGLLLVGLVLWVVNVDRTAASGLLNAGLIALMATPILRVLVSVVEYVRIRDWFFVLTTLAVLTVLFLSVALAMQQR
jgi:uncharacterized membrane protein